MHSGGVQGGPQTLPSRHPYSSALVGVEALDAFPPGLQHLQGIALVDLRPDEDSKDSKAGLLAPAPAVAAVQRLQSTGHSQSYHRHIPIICKLGAGTQKRRAGSHKQDVWQACSMRACAMTPPAALELFVVRGPKGQGT